MTASSWRDREREREGEQKQDIFSTEYMNITVNNDA